jgi:hypothetical protein
MSPRIENANAWIAPPPRPCTARNAISCPMLCARPHNNEPIRNTTIAVWKINRRP